MKQVLEEYKRKSEASNKEITRLYALLALSLILLMPLSYLTFNSVYAQQKLTTNDQLTNIVASASALIAVLGLVFGLIVRLSKKLGAQQYYTNDTFKKFVDTLESLSGSLEETDKGIKDNMDVVGLAIGSLLNNKEIADKLGQVESRDMLTKIQAEIDAWKADLEKYYSTINPKIAEEDIGNKTMEKLAIVKARSSPF